MRQKLKKALLSFNVASMKSILKEPRDFSSWESLQTLLVLLIGSFVKQFRNLKSTVKGNTNIQKSVLSSSEGTATT